MRKVKCPKCGLEWMEDVEKAYEDGDTDLIRMAGPTPPAYRTEKSVDLVCPNCKKEFEFSWEE